MNKSALFSSVFAVSISGIFVRFLLFGVFCGSMSARQEGDQEPIIVTENVAGHSNENSTELKTNGGLLHVVDAARVVVTNENGTEEVTDARFFGIGRKTKKSDKDDSASEVISSESVPSPTIRPKQPVPPPPRSVYDESVYFYKVNHPRRGTALVLNYEEFSPDRHDHASTRRGSSVDAANLVNTFSSLNFDVRRYDNLNTSETLAVLREVVHDDHSTCDCLVVCVMSHGDQVPGGETVFYTYDKTLRITEDLVQRFVGSRCASLRAKPKLFFVQACQGAKTDKGGYVQVHDGIGSSRFETKTVHIPDEADVLVAYSTPPGYYSWRNETEGSWFINELCSSIGMWAYELDIGQILTRVSHNVAVGYASRSSDPSMSNMKQCPTFVSRLTKHLRFTLPRTSQQ